jgi:hypothetical protein
MFLQSDDGPGVLWWLIILQINRKIRCTGERPICHTCQSSGHASDVIIIFSGYIILSMLSVQCTWGPEQVKRTNSKEYVQSLHRRIDGLVQYCSLLETKLDQCHKEHGGSTEDYLHLRPNLSSVEEDEQDLDLNFSDNDDDITEKLRAFHVSANTTTPPYHI